MTLGEYEGIRAMPGRFLVLPGHEGAPYRRVVSTNDRFSVVVDLARAQAARPAGPPGFGRGFAAN